MSDLTTYFKSTENDYLDLLISISSVKTYVKENSGRLCSGLGLVMGLLRFYQRFECFLVLLD